MISAILISINILILVGWLMFQGSQIRKLKRKQSSMQSVSNEISSKSDNLTVRIKDLDKRIINIEIRIGVLKKIGSDGIERSDKPSGWMSVLGEQQFKENKLALDLANYYVSDDKVIQWIDATHFDIYQYKSRSKKENELQN